MPSTVLVGAQWGDEGKGKICDLVAGDFYYSPNLKDDGNRKGFALCVQHLADYIASQMDEKKSHD